MPLSINPIKNLASNIGSSLGNLANAANQSAGNFSMPSVNFDKQNLDATVNRLSGGFGSPLNGITGKLNSSSVSNLSGTVQNFAQNVELRPKIISAELPIANHATMGSTTRQPSMTAP